MSRVKLWIEYEGSAYHGWQTQPGGQTVQDELERSFQQILQQQVHVYGQGRTDQGVHAEGQVAHMDAEVSMDFERLRYGVNGILPDDIAVWNIEQVKDDFHARFDAASRQYRYQIVRRSRPLHRRTTYKVRDSIDLESLEECARYIRGEHDFESFTKTSDEQPSAVCTVEHSKWQETEEGMLIYRIRANRFVRHLVRRLVGTMLQVGRSRMEVNHFKQKVDQPDPDTGGYSAPPEGLILEKVEYP